MESQGGIIIGHGRVLENCGVGKVKLKIKGKTLALNRVVYSPHIAANLISVRELAADGFKVEFTPTTCYVEKKRTAVGYVEGGLYLRVARPFGEKKS